MNIRHHRHSPISLQQNARPIRFILAGAPQPQAGARSEKLPGPLPSADELTRFVREQISPLYPGLLREALDGAAGQGARQALAMALASPQAAAALHAVAIQAARSIISLYLALAEQHNLRPVA